MATSYQSVACGLCGNMNNNPADDLMLPNGKLASNANEFGVSQWLANVEGCSHECKQPEQYSSSSLLCIFSPFQTCISYDGKQIWIQYKVKRTFCKELCKEYSVKTGFWHSLLLSLGISCLYNMCCLCAAGKDCALPLPPDFKPPSYTSVCDVITAKNGPLADCVGRVDSQQYRDDCIYDMVLNEGKEEAACDIISDYVEECHRKGGCVKSWRTRRFCCKYSGTLQIT